MTSLSKRQVEERDKGKVATLDAFYDTFKTDRDCEDYLFAERFPNGFVCPRCGGHRCAHIKNRTGYQCSDCGKQVSVLVGTVMQHTHVPLRKWFLTVFLLTHDKRGVSAMQIQREITVNAKTAEYMLRRIRGAMAGSGCLQRALVRDTAR